MFFLVFKQMVAILIAICKTGKVFDPAEKG